MISYFIYNSNNEIGGQALIRGPRITAKFLELPVRVDERCSLLVGSVAHALDTTVRDQFS